MNVFEKIILGIVQGLTEFLPVSSSGHLFLFEEVIFKKSVDLPFDVFLHIATLFAVLIFFRKKLWELSHGFFQARGTSERIFVGKLALATLVTVPIALTIEPYIRNGEPPKIIALELIITGICILLAEFFSPKSIREFSWKMAFLVGIFQGIAAFAGISRSGITIAFLLLAGGERKKSVEISFLLSIPVIFGAFIFEFPKIYSAISLNINEFLWGGIFAFFSAFFAIWGMMRYIQKYWKWFSVWCFAVAGALLFFG
ncbi:undecaprenyl-diphosphate phosphatase [Candidatus Peregrinibacteria bacterium]|nr:undecaprenyl-diphosphate phosphatase [Candidatus Peregrinibacteria bacterium]